MKKFTFLLVMMLVYAGFTMAQTIENSESIKMEMFAQGANSMIGAVSNPDTVSNHSLYCGKYVIGTDGRAIYAGWSTDFPNDSVDVNVTQYAHILIWKSFMSPVDLKLEHGPGNTETNDLWPMSDPTNHSNKLTSHWEELVFDLKSGVNPIKTGKFSRFTLIPDFQAVNPTTVNTIYFDNIYFNNDPAVGSAPVRVLTNFEVIPMTMMLKDALTDSSSMTAFTPNPDKSGINMSDYVVKFVRDKDGQPWDGFFADNITGVTDSLDLTTNKFIHVKVWKPRITPLRFKVYKGTADDLEIGSKYEQTTTNAWEDIVFDFRTRTGKYAGISFMPDNIEPVDLTKDIIIYFDDIVLNNDSTKLVYLTLNVDMHGSGLKEKDTVYVAGSFPDWVAPGVNASLMMTDADGDSIYTVSMVVPAGHKEFKFFKNAGYDHGEWDAGANRMLELTNDAVVNSVWGQLGFVRVRENPLAGKIQMYPNPVRDVLNINTTADVSRVIITNTLGKVVGNYTFTNNQTINTNNLSRGMYFVTFISKDGSKVSQKLIKD